MTNWVDVTKEQLQIELDKFSQEVLQQDIKARANKMLLSNAHTIGAQTQPKPIRRSLGDISPTLAEINSPDSPMALTIPTMLVLWKQRHGYKWVSEEEIVEDAYWAVIARRLHGLQMLERMEASKGSVWERVSVFRLKDDDNGY